MVKWADYKEEAKARGALALELFVVRSTPAMTPETVKENLVGHLEYQRHLEESGQLVMAGPLSDESGEEMQGSGMIIYRAGSLDSAFELASNDPMHASGARSFTITRWLVNEGNLTLSVGLSTGEVTLK